MRHLTQLSKFLKERPLLLAVLVIGFLLRISGIFWGLPSDPLKGTYHPDEWSFFSGAVEFPRHVLTNTYLVYPTFFTYFLGIISFPLRLLFDPSSASFHYFVAVIGRLSSVLAGTGAILLTYLLARDVYSDERRALLASVFLSFSLYHSHNSSFATTDVSTSFLLVLFLLLLRQAFLRPEKTSLYAVTGVVLGLLVGTKYTGALAVIVLFVLYLYTVVVRPLHGQGQGHGYTSKWHLNLLLCGTLAIVTFLITTPGIILHFDAFLNSMHFSITDLARYETPRTDLTTWAIVFQKLAVAVGYPLACLSVFSIFFPLRKNIHEISFIVLLVAFFLYFGSPLVPRYVILVMPLIAMLASNAALSLRAFQGNRLFKILGAAVIAVVTISSLGYCVAGAYLRYDDTRTQAERYIRENLPAGTRIGLAYASEVLGWIEHAWRHPTVDFTRFNYMDFLDYPEVVVVSSYELSQIQYGLASGRLSKDYVWDKRYNKEWWKFSPPSPRVFRFFDNLLDPERSKYTLLRTFGKPVYAPVEFASPEIRIYVEKEQASLLNTIGRYNAAYSEVKSYYPDNPRNYFEDGARENKWSLRVAGGSVANLVFPPRTDVVRVGIEKARTQAGFDIQLNQPGLKVRGKQRYVLKFRAQADRPRSIIVGFAKAHEPWTNIGLYRKIELTTQWQHLDENFVVTDNEDNARIHFDIGENATSVEFSSVSLHRLPDGQSIEPDRVSKDYFVSYKFNALGCRGPDYPIPRPKGTMRLLLLGNSYTLGLGVHEGDTFPFRLGQWIDGRDEKQGSGKTYEVISCGVRGYGVREERLFYEILASKYDPQVVLLVLAPEDDRSQSDGLKIGNPVLPSQFAESSASVEEVIKLNEAVRRRGARVAVVIFRNTESRASAQFVNDVTRGLKDSGIPVLDLGKTLLEGHSPRELFVYPGLDLHPNELAHGIAAKEMLRFVQAEHLLNPR